MTEAVINHWTGFYMITASVMKELNEIASATQDFYFLVKFGLVLIIY